MKHGPGDAPGERSLQSHSSEGEETDVNKTHILSAWQSVESKRKLSNRCDASMFGPAKRKLWESGPIQKFALTSFVVYFETVPVWLLALEPYFVETIYFIQFATFSALRQLVVRLGGFYVELLARFDISTFKFNSNGVNEFQSSSLTLVSGSLTFLKHFVPSLGNAKMIFILDKHCKVRKVPDFRPKLHRIKHFRLGGGTKYETIFASMNVDLIPSETNIRRNIASFLDFSQYSKPWLSPGNKELHQFDLYPITSNIRDYDVVMDSNFASSGFGRRQLTLKELAALFGLPRALYHVIDENVLPIVPTQILDAILQPLLKRVTPLIDDRKSKRLRVSAPVPNDAPVYLSELGKTIPNLWAQSEDVSQQAAKNDDAAVDFKKWDLRVITLWPRATFLIPALRKLLLQLDFFF